MRRISSLEFEVSLLGRINQGGIFLMRFENLSMRCWYALLVMFFETVSKAIK